MNKQQFRNLNLFTIRYPFTAIISLLHRLSGIFVFLLIPFLLWMLDIATGSTIGFERVQTLLTNLPAKLMLWLFLVALFYHLIAGIRHLLMDIGIGESLRSARISGGISLIITVLVAILLGSWLW
ncbi:succinate dehydrogenase, cytochrome b556 subunit [Legionella drozanskii LLAP-1]|uniref:Succinate dehydrogenase cytochrome b556 subunit n=2 Tax=Legionella drozanskii TaxID=96228 RepID=A0A0W0T0I6_9GAMM|nr:succinate dehydrogenase, cytochrome b556 subunit [Legionella drozanskii LLAP-1]